MTRVSGLLYAGNTDREGAHGPCVCAVPHFTYDPADVIVEDGVTVYRRVTLISVGLTTDPADPHVTPIERDRGGSHE